MMQLAEGARHPAETKGKFCAQSSSGSFAQQDVQTPQVSSCPAHLQCSAANSQLGQPQEDTGLRTFLSVPQGSRVTPSVEVAEQL